MIFPSFEYLADREKYLDNPRVLKELTRLEKRLAREGKDACKDSHRINDVWTIYLNEGRRVLVRPEGRVVHLVRLGEHDDVYRDQKRSKNPPEATESPAAVATGPRLATTTAPAPALFAHLDDDFLTRLGVLPNDVDLVRSCLYRDDVWPLQDSLGEDIVLRLDDCLDRPPAQVLHEYEIRGRDDEILEDLARTVEEARLAERTARESAEREAEDARTAAAQAQGTLAAAQRELEEAHQRLAREDSGSARLQQLERTVADLQERLPRLMEEASHHASKAEAVQTDPNRRRRPTRATPPTSAPPSISFADIDAERARDSASIPTAGPRPGSRWHEQRGDDRWTLSQSSRSFVRHRDNRSLHELVGASEARVLVQQFLRVRPRGGRAWVDDEGNAVTLVEGDLVFLGNIGATITQPVPQDNTLQSALIRAISHAPGSTARELALQLRKNGFSGITRREVNSTLHGNASTFVKDGADTPRWRLVDAAVTSGSQLRPRTPISRPVLTTDRGVPALRTMAHSIPDHESDRRIAPVLSRVAARDCPALTLDLWAWQQEALTAWYANGCRGIVEAVTGTGKTLLGLEAAAHARADGQRTTVLVPSIDLQEQWVDRFQRFLPHLSVATLGGHKSGNPESADVTIAVVHSALNTDLSALSPDSLLVADEVHRYGAAQFQYALRARYQRRLGLTATLERSGDDAVQEVLLPYFGGSIMTVGFDRALREGVVAPFKLVMAPVTMSEDEQAEYDALSQQVSNGLKVLRSEGALGSSGGSTIVQQLGRLRGAGGRIGNAARSAESGMRKRRQLLARLEGKLDAIEELSEVVAASEGSVIFTQSKEVADEATQRLREWGVQASALHGDMGNRERREVIAGLTTGRIQALAAPKLLDEGIDLPSVDVGIVMTASRSRRQMVQRLGRVIRRKEDGRPVTFILLYAHDTVEDPESGVHEGFFDLVGEVADDTTVLEPGWTADDLPVLRGGDGALAPTG